MLSRMVTTEVRTVVVQTGGCNGLTCGEGERSDLYLRHR